MTNKLTQIPYVLKTVPKLLCLGAVTHLGN